MIDDLKEKKWRCFSANAQENRHTSRMRRDPQCGHQNQQRRDDRRLRLDAGRAPASRPPPARRAPAFCFSGVRKPVRKPQTGWKSIGIFKFYH